MKNLKIYFAILLLTISASSFAQSNSKVITLVTKANWCSICKANGERVVAKFTENNSDGFFQFVPNDITDASTKKISKIELIKNGIDKLALLYPASGLITFIDSKTKKVLMQLTVANTNEELTFVMGEARKLASK